MAAMQAALKKISASLPELSSDADNLSGLLARSMAAAYLGEGASS